MTVYHRTASVYRPGAHTMPADYYTSPAILALETERIFLTQWHCVGRVDRLAHRGDFFLETIADESLIVLRDRHGDLRAFFNVCRHRGTRLCQAEAGHLSETIQCPYHAWTWTTDGRLVGAPHMQEVDGFDKTDYPLHQAAIAEWEGFVFVNLAPDPAPFEQAFAPMIDRLSRFGLDRLSTGHAVRYEVASNWKLVFQNYSECLHCPTLHPELSCRLPYQSGANDLVEGPFLGGYMEITEGFESVTTTGARVGPWIGDLTAEDRRRAYYYTLMPNLLLSIHPDYVNYYLVSPDGVGRTIVKSEWLFHPDAVADPDFDPSGAVEMWDLTNRQDWFITEQSLAGIRSRRYSPGPYSARESIPAAWDRAYLDLLGRDRA